MVEKRKIYIVANWKMNFTVSESSLFLHKLSEKVRVSHSTEVILAPSLFTLQPLSLQINRRQFKLAAQNFYWRDFGAYTGEVSIAQLRGIVEYALVGHSERRYIFNETDRDIREKVAAAIRSGVTPIICIGETGNERAFGETSSVIYDQLVGGLTEVSSEDIDKVVIAYEPVWAISTTTGATTCSPDDVAAAAKLIRSHVGHLYGKAAAGKIRVLFGGSVDDSNAGDYLDVADIDGLLVGGASLKLELFDKIVAIAQGKALKIGGDK